jgi:uncharacterized membrane protein
MKNSSFFLRIQTYFWQGLFAVIPLFICTFTIYLVYVLIDKKVVGFIDNFINVRHIPGLGLLLVIVFLCLVGMIVSNFIGKKIFKYIEKISQRIPVLGTLYGIGKQLTQSFAMDSKNPAFKKAVLVKFNGSDLTMPGFVMGSTRNAQTNEEIIFVYIPTVPTPMGGFIFMAKASQIVDPGWTIEECLKVIVSMGIISPPKSNM